MKYLCGSCKESREEEHIEMTQHPDESIGKVPICTDKPCKITDVEAPSSNIRDSDSFKVDKPLK